MDEEAGGNARVVVVVGDPFVEDEHDEVAEQHHQERYLRDELAEDVHTVTEISAKQKKINQFEETSKIICIFYHDGASITWVDFLENPHGRRPIARLLGRGMGCLLWVETLIYVMPKSLPFCVKYRKTSNISSTLVGNKIVDDSDVAGASPVGAAPTTSSFST